MRLPIMILKPKEVNIRKPYDGTRTRGTTIVHYILTGNGVLMKLTFVRGQKRLESDV